jgi:photosystem II stability/assembly factor-like uncharacterized protein
MFDGVAFPTAADGWLIGQPGAGQGATSTTAVIWHTSTSGATWQVQWRGAGYPLSLTATDAAHAWALIGCQNTGCSPELVGTADGGQHWRALTRLPGGVRQVQLISSGIGLATSDKCVVAPSETRCPSKVLISDNGGLSWQVLLSAAGPVFATADAAGQLWAAEGVVSDDNGAGPQVASVRLLTSVDGGRAWRQLSLVRLVGEPATPNVQIALAATSSGLSLMSVFDRETCAMHGCGTMELLQSSDGGYQWSQAALSGFPNECGLNEMLFATAPDGAQWAVTGVGLAACSPPGGLLYRRGAGGDWQQLPSWQFSEIGSLAAVSSEVAYAISDSSQGTGFSVLSRTENGGRTWTDLLPALAPAGQLVALSSTTALGAQDALSPGSVLRSTDRGRSWQQFADLPGVLLQLAFPSRSDGIAVTYEPGTNYKSYSELWRSTDGGLTWNLTGRLPGKAGFENLGSYGPWMSADGDGVLLTAPQMIPWYPGAGNGGPETVWTTTDWGAHWVQEGTLPTDLISSASFACSAACRTWTGWLAVQQQTYSLMRASGQNLAPLPNSPVASHVQLLGGGTGAAWILSPGPLSGLSIWRTTDGGLSWQQTRTDITTTLPVLLDFTDINHGWLVTGTTTWQTANGGRTWTHPRPS